MIPACPRCGLLHPPGATCFSLRLGTLRGKDDLQVGTILAGRYRIERILHRGGMGVVYLAMDLRQGLPVVVKGLELLDNASPEERHEAEMWFARECFLLSMLRHPLIPAFHGSFRDGGRSYLAQEYVEGENLDALLARQGPLDPRRVAGWADLLCRLLAYLHGLPIPVIFRDLKPANIVLRPDGLSITVVDFGIARPYAPGVVGTVIGTPGYAPPEQYQGLATPQSDVYALGATLHRLLTGYDPEHGPPFTFPPVRDLKPDVPASLAVLVARAIQLNPADRFASAVEMGAALAPAGYSPAIAAPASTAPRPANARSRPLAWIVAALLGLLLLPSAVFLELRFGRPSPAAAPPITAVIPTATALAQASPTMPAVRTTGVIAGSQGTCVPVHGGHFQRTRYLTLGPDGAIWFASDDQQWIGRIADDGQITACRPSAAIDRIDSLTTSGNLLWFSETARSEVGYLTSAGQVVTFQLPHTLQGVYYDIAPAGDGSVWVGEAETVNDMAIAHITPAGGITEFPLPGIQGFIEVFGAALDGTVWFSSDSNQSSDFLDPAGQVTRLSLPMDTTFASDSHGTVWYVSDDGSAIGQISRQGITNPYSLGNPIDPKRQQAGTPISDASGNLWFAVSGVNDHMHNWILEITAGGRLRRYSLPLGIDAFPCVAGPGGAIWFANDNANSGTLGKIDRLEPNGSVREYDAVF